jgi:MOSC domain-containing protein YiiM
MVGKKVMPRLLSVNVGLPRDIAWRGKTVRTAIWKTPVQGGRMVRRLNIDGDGQGDLAGHGGEHRAVFVYQIDSYHYWQSQLGRNDFTYGQFGENFTVDGLSDQEVCIGDRYRVGGALFEVTQPRVTCYRVASAWRSRRWPRCWSRTADPVSICVCWRKAKWRPATRSCGSRQAPNA